MLDKKDYSVDDNLSQNDEDVLASFIDYSGSTYICDAISEIADRHVSIYNATICEECWNLYSSGAYEEASSQGLMDDLIKNLQMAWYEYNTQQLYNNLQEMVFNYAVDYINDKYSEIEIDEDKLEEVLSDIDNNNTFDNIEEAVNTLIEEIKEEKIEEFQEEIEEIENEISELEDQVNDEEIDDEEYKVRLEKLEKQKKEIEEKIQELES